MNIIDVIIILIVLMCGVIGMKKGFVRSTVALVGIVVVFILSFSLKNPIAEWMSLNLPFFSFAGSLKGATILNVIIYQLISFFIIFSILMTLYSLLVYFSKVIEKILNFTFILRIPSQFGGFLVGSVMGVIVSLVLVMILSLPILNFDLIRGSYIRKYLYTNSPVMGYATRSTNEAIDEIIDLKDEFENSSDRETFNLSCLEILLKHKVIDANYSEKLVYSGKLKVNEEKAKYIIDKYKN